MMKLSQFLRSSRSSLAEKLLTGQTSNATNSLWAQHFSSQSAYSVSSSNPSSRIYSEYTVFKGKAALSVSPRLPTLNSNSPRYDKKGVVFMTFWPAIGERKYNWEKRQIFALSPTEVGAVISLEPNKSCEFFHDPSMKSSTAGQVRKSLAVTPLGDENGYFFTLTVVNNIEKTNERLSVPVSKAEFTVMRTAFSYILPHIMGWDQVTKQAMTTSREQSPVKQQEIRLTPNLEWDR